MTASDLLWAIGWAAVWTVVISVVLTCLFLTATMRDSDDQLP